MKNIILIFFFTEIFIFSTLVATAQEDGWKNLKWGMTLQEVKNIYEKFSNDEGRCNHMETLYFNSDLLYGKDKKQDKSIRWVDIPPKIQDRLIDVWFDCNVTNTSGHIIDSHIFFYNNKFYGKRVDVNFKDATSHEIIIKQLQEKYSNGSVKRTFEYPIFEYRSERITVFSTSNALYFYDTKTLNEILDEIANEKRNENEVKQEKLKKLF